MRNSKSAYLFTYNNIWKLVFISIINAVSIPPSLQYNPGKQTHTHTNKQQSSFNNIDITTILTCCCIMIYSQILAWMRIPLVVHPSRHLHYVSLTVTVFIQVTSIRGRQLIE